MANKETVKQIAKDIVGLRKIREEVSSVYCDAFLRGNSRKSAQHQKTLEKIDREIAALVVDRKFYASDPTPVEIEQHQIARHLRSK